MSDHTAHFFDGYAADFDSIYGNDNRGFEQLINRLFRRSMLIRYEKTIAGCEPIAGCTVLDIGCGPGHYSVALARAGAERVVGLDFAPGMLNIARKHAARQGVAQRCSFELADFLRYPVSCSFDYSILMGFMDYVSDASRVIERVLALTQRRAFFSFPAAGGWLAWQRQMRYRGRCDLFLYDHDQIHDLFTPTGASFSIARIGRDFFVTLEPAQHG